MAATRKKKTVKTQKKTKKKPVKKITKKTTQKKSKKATRKSPTKAKKASPAKKTPVKAASRPSSSHPLIGQSAPEMELTNQRGETVNVAELARSAQKVVLYFYPKDDTPGCTAEACAFRDSFQRLQASGIKVFGVSPDDASSHQKFIAKYNLNFDLISDSDHKLCEAMKVWKEKNFMGRSYMGVERSTFLFTDGIIVKAWQPVKVDGHVDEVLNVAS